MGRTNDILHYGACGRVSKDFHHNTGSIYKDIPSIKYLDSILHMSKYIDQDIKVKIEK